MTYIYNSPINLNISKIPFKSSYQTGNYVTKPTQDNFVTNPLTDKFKSAQLLETEAKNNPRISALLNRYNLPVKVNVAELEKLQKGHLKNTRIVAAQIYSNLPQELKKEANLKQIQDAAMLHDYGKILIPDDILNKKGELTPSETEIMQLHSELGYELLRNKGFDEEILNLVKYHHQTPKGRGYPVPDKNFNYDINLQILNTADKYTALTEERCYKPALPKTEALQILSKDVDVGFIKPEVFEALKKAV